jgi:hypothetical protein
VEALDGLLEAVALDEAHGVKGPAVGIGAQTVNRYDARMLQPTDDLRLPEEAGPTGWIVGVAILDLLQGDFTVQFFIAGDGDLT